MPLVCTADRRARPDRQRSRGRASQRRRAVTVAVASAALVGSAVLVAPAASADVKPGQVQAQQAAIGAIQWGHDNDRAANRLDPLVRDPRMDAVAQAWTNEMADNADAGAGGSALVHSPADPAFDYWTHIPAGARGGGENIAYSYKLGGDMYWTWMNSAGHRANILNPAFDSVGYGISYDDSGRMWGTTVFADYANGPRTPPPPSTSTPPALPGETTWVNGATYKLVNRHSGKVLGVTGMSTAAGAGVLQWSDTGTKDHLWKAKALSNGQLALVNVNSGKNLGIKGASTVDGTRAVQGTPSAGKDQKWTLVRSGGYFKVRNAKSGDVLGVNGMSTADGAAVVQWSDNGTPDHEWKLVKVS